ncbi:MAG: nitrous oxide reductase accessory protein NosL [Desulforhopalus sp.]
MKKIVLIFCCIFLAKLSAVSGPVETQPVGMVDGKTRCPVCGMFVARYQQWLTQMVMADGKTEAFDGVKDMMAYYFSPDQFGGPTDVTASRIFVKDYYSQTWIDGRKAFYVIGSDVYGPMGHELIPFNTRDAAENFLKDHHGRQIFPFFEISAELIKALRKGQTMKGMN